MRNAECGVWNELRATVNGAFSGNPAGVRVRTLQRIGCADDPSMKFFIVTDR